MASSLLQRLDARDRALFARWVLQRSTRARTRSFWIALTHLGSASSTIAFAALPLIGVGPLTEAGAMPVTVLVLSHVVIQGIKRSIGRPRPSVAIVHASLIHEPDRFSFPSGHSAAAMSIALGFAYAFPELAAALVMLAVIVGLSRVVLGVHYPGDVFAGQLIAVITGVVVTGWGVIA
jgi:undecaprenyl-diphosphatase